MKLKAVLIFFFSFSVIAVFAQEQLIGLSSNNLLEKHASQKSTKAVAVSLPFFDDFSQTEILPNPNLWEDGFAFVNTGFQYLPANRGVATFDALDASGKIYEHANSFTFIADYLTSQPIRLDSLLAQNKAIEVADSLYFSFYFQPQGLGNAPEASDSLVLEFYSGRDAIWYPIWSAPGMSLEAFYAENATYCKQILIPITDSAKFFHPDFKFRFYNYASLANSIETSWQSNADQWNIDYVKLDVARTRNDIYSKDLSFVNQPPSFLKKYRTMPYNQYKNDPTNSMAQSLDSMLISNLSGTDYTAEYQYKISDQVLQDSIYFGGSASIAPFFTDAYSDFPRFRNPSVISFFSLYEEEEKEYTITHTIRNIIGDLSIGDTLLQKQYFGTYFAYDDGSAEAGYGLSSSGSSAALRFKLNTPDTLTQIQIAFNPTLIPNQDYFYLTVWESLEPEVILYEKLVQVTDDRNENGFVEYEIDEPLLLSNEFFVGFTQTSNSNLNVGFDLSFHPEESLYYDSGDGWNSSVFKGSLMIRTNFARYTGTIETPIIVPEQVSIYPNPLKSTPLKVFIQNGEQYNIQVFDLIGKLVYESPYRSSIDLSFLQEGVYIMRFENKLNGDTKSQKLIISR